MDMNDSRPTDRFSPSLPGSGQQGPWYPPPADPAYADQTPYAPAYGGQAPPWANDTNTTKQLPAYWQHELPPSGQLPHPGLAPPQPEGPKPPPRWLWIVAGAAVLLVVALVVALVLVNDAIKTQTAVPPLPAMPETTPTMPSPSTRPSQPRIPAPVPPTGGSPAPSESPGPAGMQDIVYSVAGEGRAISIMYIDTGDLIQTEFNVALPWSKEVSLPNTAAHPANVTIVNIGHNVTCSVTVNGVQMSKRVGAGLTICDARG
ncbi:MmpS family transport accessory protein [Mycobacterium sp. E342]|uniref:MmpS family transport accessory protein n=1 Tax=Mycobacterium sp. E342 TaxID=1834147 RepID=UPI0009ED794C|nr:MmpS family transport accessory protein [Mycobacterium sp. E342]